MTQTQFEITGRVISKKNSKRMFKSRKTGKMFPVSSKAYKTFETDALFQLLAVRQTIDTPVHIDFLFCTKGKQFLDIDAGITSILDILQKSEIIADDKLVKSTYAKMEHGYQEWKTYVRIIEL